MSVNQPKMKINRLVILARHLRTIADKVPVVEGRGTKVRGFNLSSWFGTRLDYPRKDHAARDCGTTACAFGEATYVPEFKALGLKRQGRGVAFGGAYDMGAAAKFFGISFADANRLFNPRTYPTSSQGPLDVVKKIENLITRPEA